jgi:hypothetical protein
MPSKKSDITIRNILFRWYSPALTMPFIFFISLTSFAFILGTAVASEKENEVLNLMSFIQERTLRNTIVSLRSEKRKVSYETPELVKGIYATAYTASTPSRLDGMVNLITTTELNSIVIDIKTDGGYLIFNAMSEQIDTADTEKILIEDMPLLIEQLQEEGIYTIARMTVFQDPALVAKRPDLAIGSTDGGVWKDWKGVTWLDPHSTEVWEYVVAIANAAIDVGFQEINFDYIRFPSDGPLSKIIYRHGDGSEKVKTLNSFFAYLDSELPDEVNLSVDLFGITLWSDNDFNIGQTLVGAAPYFDYIMPMVYPSHYPDGFNGYANPADVPYEIISQNLERGEKKIEGQRAKLRPWLQDFDLGAVYTPTKVRAQITATEERDTNGWILWNASNNYTVDALHSSNE